MRRKVTLAGELKEKFGEVFYVNADSHQSILKCINANRPEFKQYLLDSIDKNVGFTIDMAGESVAEEDLLIPLKEGDVTITAIPAGSKSGMGKILAAIALAVLVVFTAGTALLAATPGAATGFAATMSAGMGATFSGMQMMGMGLAVNLAMAGIQQLMAPDPAVDSGSPTNYMYQGSAQTIIEGDPVPILYGELRVPGRPVGLDIINGVYRNNNVTIDSNNNISILDSELQEEFI
tara:strand:- start:4 stop:708 length:705 start_codon:yes stop_codon:yes gene_type:complete